MSKQMQKIVIFIEPCDDAFSTPEKMGYVLMNRCSVDEDASFEVLNIFELRKSSWKMYESLNPDYASFEIERKEKGMGLSNIVFILESPME